jgi:hypothetical protein
MGCLSKWAVICVAIAAAFLSGYAPRSDQPGDGYSAPRE